MTTHSVSTTVIVPLAPKTFRLADGQRIPVSAIDDAGLRAIGQAWTEQLIENATRQRAASESHL